MNDQPIDLGKFLSLKYNGISATATVQVAKAAIIGNNEDGTSSNVGGASGSGVGGAGATSSGGDGDDNDSVADDFDDNGEDFWHTSVGKFRFSLDSLPQYLQYIHQLLTVCFLMIFDHSTDDFFFLSPTGNSNNSKA